jgi:hypothetical protein
MPSMRLVRIEIGSPVRDVVQLVGVNGILTEDVRQIPVGYTAVAAESGSAFFFEYENASVTVPKECGLVQEVLHEPKHSAHFG